MNQTLKSHGAWNEDPLFCKIYVNFSGRVVNKDLTDVKMQKVSEENDIANVVEAEKVEQSSSSISLIALDTGGHKDVPNSKASTSTSSCSNAKDKPSSSELKLMSLNDSKAGMKGLDLDRINQIIHETSKGSKFYEHKKQRQIQLDQKIEEIKRQAEAFTREEILRSEKQVDAMAKELEDNRDLSRVIVHIDMDAFFASVEMRDDPSLRDIPMAVGGMSMLATSNYIARRWGVRAAMPGFVAKKLCPQLVIVPGNHEKYSKASKEVHEVLMEYDKEFLSMSLDEAYFDITEYLATKNSLLSEASQLTPEELVHEIRQKIFEKTQLTASAGIAANGLLGKICGDIRKPNNQFYLEPTVQAIKEFMKVLPIRKVCGIGNVTEQMLKGLDVHTCGDIWDKRGLVNLLFKPATLSFLIAVSLGIGHNGNSFAQDSGSEDRKSVSCETTFTATSDREVLKGICKNLCDELEGDLHKKEVSAKTITLKIKTDTFQVKTRARSIAEYTSSASTIFHTVWAIYLSYEKEIDGSKLRLMGVRVSKLKFKSDDNTEDKPGCSSKQTTIEQMFAKTQESIASFACPICNDKFHLMRDLNLHIDCCLAQELPKEESTSMTTFNNCSLTSNNLYELLEKEPQNVKDPQTEVSCPICSMKFKFQSETEADLKMNSHIDECLNKSTLKDIFQESQQRSSSLNSGKRSSEYQNVKTGPTKKKKSCNVPIDSYFKPT